MKWLSFIAILAILMAAGCTAAPSPPHGQFEVFLLSDTTVRIHHYAGTRLEVLPLAESPWISSADISSYEWETHEIILKDESAGLVENFRDPLGGPDIPFVVVANGERIKQCLTEAGLLKP